MTARNGGGTKRREVRRVWLVICDGSILGGWRTKKTACSAMRTLSEHALFAVGCHVKGPYVLQDKQ